MTVSTTKASDVFPGNGIATGFDCAWRIFDDTDILVSLVDQATGADTPLVLNTDYTISGAGDQAGFTVATMAPVASGTNLYVRRALAYEQPTDFTNQGAFFPTMHEDAMDRLEMQIQQLAASTDLSLKMPGGITPTPSPHLPPPSPLSPLVWNADGTALENGSTSLTGDMLLRPDLASTATGKGAALLAFIQDFTGAVPQTVEGELRKSASLLNAGCVGDGSDESAKIQAVLDSGLDVYIPAGTFTATGLTLSTNGARLYGPGMIKKKAGVDGVLLTIAADDCIIDGVRFDGTASQPSLTSVNNIINIAGNRNKVLACYLNGSAGGGITVNAGFCYNVIAFNTIKNTDDNNIMVSGAEANDNLILGNYCDTTTQQNNIFITASPGSTATTNYNYRNRIIANTCLNSGDTGIEAGIHSVGVVIQGNTVMNSHNPEILLRDSVGCIVEGNHVEAGTNAISTHDGIAVLLQTETDWRYRAIIKGNRVTGKITRAGIYTQDGHDLQIEGNSIEETFATVNATTGAGLVGRGIVLTNSADDIVIRGNTIRRMSVGIDLNQAAQTPTHNRVTVDNNAIYDAGTGINLFQTTLVDSTVRENRIGKLASTGINTSTSSGSNSSYLARNIITTAGYSGASPTYMTNLSVAALGWFTSENARRATVPETQYGYATLSAGAQRTGGTLAIEFEDGTEDAVFGVSKTATGKIAGTPNLVDSTGSAGSTGWSLFYDGSQNLILQRRAATTGSSNRFFRYRFVQNSNEV